MLVFPLVIALLLPLISLLKTLFKLFLLNFKLLSFLAFRVSQVYR